MPINSLAEASIGHLQREVDLMERLHVIVQEMRSAMLSQDDDRITKILSSMQQIDFGQVHAERERYRQQIATVLGITPGRANFRALSRRCDPSTAEAILSLCEQLRGIARNVSTLSIANGNLAFQLWEVLEKAFCALGGANGAPIVYEASGHRRVA